MYYGYGMMWDSTYILVIIGTVLCLMASANVKSTFARYSKKSNARGLTGAEVASQMLREAGLNHIRVEHISGNLSDHYDPKNKVLRLSDDVYGSTSVAAIGVAAHECGHAIQDKENYGPLRIRHALVPVANFGTNAALPILIISTILGLSDIFIQIGLFMFALGVLFQFVTLPVEFDASRRAVTILEGRGILSSEEIGPTKKVLKAAALTYVASAVAVVLSLLRLIILFGRNRD